MTKNLARALAGALALSLFLPIQAGASPESERGTLRSTTEETVEREVSAGLEEIPQEKMQGLLLSLALGTEQARKEASEEILAIGEPALDPLLKALHVLPTKIKPNTASARGAALGLLALNPKLSAQERTRVIRNLEGILSSQRIHDILEIDPKLEGHPHTWMKWALPAVLHALRMINPNAADKTISRLREDIKQERGLASTVIRDALKGERWTGDADLSFAQVLELLEKHTPWSFELNEYISKGRKVPIIKKDHFPEGKPWTGIEAFREAAAGFSEKHFDANFIRWREGVPEERLHAEIDVRPAGLEEDWRERLSEVARQMQNQGWIESAQQFERPFLRAGEYASDKLRAAGNPEEESLWKTRQQALSDLSILLREVFTHSPKKSAVQVLHHGSSGNGSYLHATLRLPTPTGPFVAALTINRKRESPKLSIVLRRPSGSETDYKRFPVIGIFTLGKDLASLPARPPIHLDIRDGAEGLSWRGHQNLFHVWRPRNGISGLSRSAQWKKVEQAYMSFQERMIDKLEKLAEIQRPEQLPRQPFLFAKEKSLGLQLLSREGFEKAYPSEKGRAPEGARNLLVLELPFVIHVYWQANLADVVNPLMEKGRSLTGLAGSFKIYDEVFTQPRVLAQKKPGVILWDRALGNQPPFNVRLPLILYQMGEPFRWTFPRLILAAQTGSLELPPEEMEPVGQWTFSVQQQGYLVIAISD